MLVDSAAAQTYARGFIRQAFKRCALEFWTLRGEDERKKLEDLNKEFAPLAKLMKEVLDVKVEETIVSYSTVDSRRALATSAH